MSITPEEKQQAMNLGGSMRLLQTTIQRYHSEMVGPLIPEQASDQNQLADKEFVNSSITAATADPAKLGIGVGTCSTEAATQEKTVTLQDYQLKKNGFVAVTFENDVPANATLNVNGKGAKPIYYKGAAIEADTIKAADTVTFAYDGTNYVVVSLGDSELDGKVDKVEGKGLSTNDYTTDEKTKLSNAVTGPASSTDAHVAVFKGATGKIVKDSGFTIAKSVPSDAKFTDTTYSSKAAESGGTDVSLCTTGEKYTWNSQRAPKLTIADYTTAGANYTIFASVSSSSTSRYKDCTVLISGAGYYYSNGFTGTWIVEMRSSTSGAVQMDVRCIAKPATTATVKFGYYTENNVTYFGIHSTSCRGEFNVTTLLNNSGLFTIAAGTPVTAAPTGWTEATTKMSLHDNDFTANNKGTSVDKILVTDANNGLGYSTPSDLASVLGVYNVAFRMSPLVKKDLNDIYPNMQFLNVWQCDSCSNAPSTWGYLIVFRWATGSGNLEFTQVFVKTETPKVWIRGYDSVSFSAWKEF